MLIPMIGILPKPTFEILLYYFGVELLLSAACGTFGGRILQGSLILIM